MTNPLRIDQVRKRNPNNQLCEQFGWLVICLGVAWQGIAFAVHPADNISFPPQPDVQPLSGRMAEPISPIEAPNTYNLDGRVRLGEKLFHDERLDHKKRRTSCATCHNLEVGGTDQLAFSVNSAGNATHFNTPTIFNVSLNSQYYWSGKFDTLHDQIDDALKEINTSWPQLMSTLKGIPSYVKEFNSLYEDGITRDNIKNAFVVFENSLVTPGAPFDNYLKGDSKAITQNALQGYRLFKSYGCITCHQGKNIGGNVVINLDKLSTPFGKLNSTRHRLNGKLEYIRVPSLRNVAVTAPYFHDGSATTLYQAVKRMIDEYSGMEVSDNDIYKIVSFLRSLTGKYQGKSL